ncbi:MAG: hypothetical protein HOP08_05075 [Cyclobacteriaceae bacterium]|nr:hypothetical protein [Cyclobacteriaceae bacterium]
MKTFKESQFGWPTVLVMIPAQIFIIWSFFAGAGKNSSLGSMITISSIFIVVGIFFYRMKTVVDQKRITVSFGVGIIRKSIAMSRIKSIREVKNSWFSGWGIRFLVNGMLYNITGFKAVEISFYDTNRFVRIGTKDPALLKNEIEMKMSGPLNGLI